VIVGTGGEHTISRGGSVRLTLPDTVDAIPVARSAVDVIAFSVEPELRENTQLVVSELVTNGLQHGRGRWHCPSSCRSAAV
jgi:hypothetical protein